MHHVCVDRFARFVQHRVGTIDGEKVFLQTYSDNKTSTNKCFYGGIMEYIINNTTKGEMKNTFKYIFLL